MQGYGGPFADGTDDGNGAIMLFDKLFDVGKSKSKTDSRVGIDVRNMGVMAENFGQLLRRHARAVVLATHQTGSITVPFGGQDDFPPRWGEFQGVGQKPMDDLLKPGFIPV